METKHEIILKGSNISIAEQLMNRLNLGVATQGRNANPEVYNGMNENPEILDLWKEYNALSFTPEDDIWHISKGARYEITIQGQLGAAPFSVNHGSEEQKRFSRMLDGLGKEVNNYTEQRGYASQSYYYAGIREAGRIYADCVFFGREAGANLADVMVVDFPQTDKVSVSYPDFQVYKDYNKEASPTTFAEYFKSGTALPFLNYEEFRVFFGQMPPEVYDEVTFTIEIPIECEYMQQIIYGKDYPEEYYEQGLVERNENRVLRGSVTVRFED